MPEYGCRAFWKCIDGFSVGHCCSEDSAYVEGMGCLEDVPCFDSCPPEGGIAVRRKENKNNLKKLTSSCEQGFHINMFKAVPYLFKYSLCFA